MGSNQGWLKFTLDSGNVVSATDNPGATNYAPALRPSRA
jgi:hypothetical protein